MSRFNREFEEKRKAQMTPEKIMFIARRDGMFSVSLRWRDDWLRARCIKLRKERHLVGGRRVIRGQLVFHPRNEGADDGRHPRTDPQPQGREQIQGR